MLAHIPAACTPTAFYPLAPVPGSDVVCVAVRYVFRNRRLQRQCHLTTPYAIIWKSGHVDPTPYDSKNGVSRGGVFPQGAK